MKKLIVAGTTSRIEHVWIQDNSVAGGKTGLVYTDMTAYYVKPGGTLTAMTLETISTLGTWASSGDNYLGFKLLDDTNAPGLYELHIPNNLLASGNGAVIILTASGAVPCALEIQLEGANIQAFQGNSTVLSNWILALIASPEFTVDDSTFSPSTSAFETDATESTTDHYKGRIIIFTSGALLGQACSINAYEFTANSKGKFTVSTLTEAPANGITFKVV